MQLEQVYHAHVNLRVRKRLLRRLFHGREVQGLRAIHDAEDVCGRAAPCKAHARVAPLSTCEGLQGNWKGECTNASY